MRWGCRGRRATWSPPPAPRLPLVLLLFLLLGTSLPGPADASLHIFNPADGSTATFPTAPFLFYGPQEFAAVDKARVIYIQVSDIYQQVGHCHHAQSVGI
jgi:hypothetical protein